METGGKRRRGSSQNFEEFLPNMTSERKRAKMNNNNSFKDNKHLQEMGVDLLPSSDEEDECASNAGSISNQLTSDRSDESSMDSMVHQSPKEITKPCAATMITPPDQILTFKNRKSVKSTSKQDYFNLLSDEIILMILQWVPRRSLSECALVCRRWRRISYDESLWHRIDVSNSVLKTDNVGYMLLRNPYVLRMSQVEVVSPMFQEVAPAMEDFSCQVQFLDLSMALIGSKDLAELLGKCKSLKKLSVEHCLATNEVCSSIAANANLEVLNMSQCYQLGAAGLEEILINCTELVELNLSWTKMDSVCIDVVCKLVNENIHQLNLSGGLAHMKNSHVKELVSRCTCLTHLDLSDCTDLSDVCLEPIIKHLCDIQELSFSRCYGINVTSYLKLRKLKSLEYLNIFGLMLSDQLRAFRPNFQRIHINAHEFSTVARPTVGIRRTSIWHERVRD